MKRIIGILVLTVLIVSLCITMMGCSNVQADDLKGMIENAVKQEIISKTDYTLKAYGTSVSGNEKIYYELNYKTGNHNKAKFTIIDERDFKYTKYTTSFYGASVPEGKYTDFWQSFPDSLFKLEKASEEDYQDWYFYPATLYYNKNAEGEEVKYYTQKQNDSQSSISATVKRQFENGWQDFMAQEKIAKCDLNNLAKAVEGIKDYIDENKTKVTTQGKTDKFIFKIKDDCPVVYQGENLAGKTVELNFTNKKISYFNLEGKFKIYVAYGGAKILMPNYNTKSLINYDTQIVK